MEVLAGGQPWDQLSEKSWNKREKGRVVGHTVNRTIKDDVKGHPSQGCGWSSH